MRERIRWDEQDTKKSVEAFLELLKELREKTGAREATILLMIDQCEELLTGGANEEGNRFLVFLRAVLDREDSSLMLLVTLRSDFLGSFQDHLAMRGLGVETFPVPQMQVDDFASVIEGPAKLAGLELGPGLVQAMISDTKTTDALPLLAFTLRELYEGYGEDKQLTLEEYRDKLGRLDGCIRKAAEAVLSAKALSEKEVSDLRTAFLSMVRVADNDQYAKQPVQWNELPASIHNVLERFVTARLLISSGDAIGRTLEVAHEALFRAWPRLAEWLDVNKSFLVWQQRLREVIKQYAESEGKPDFLLHGFSLTEALEWQKKKPDSFSEQEQEFVLASKNRKTRERLAAAIVAGLVVLLIGGTTWLWNKGYSVDQAIQKVQSAFFSIHIAPNMTNVPGGTYRQGDINGLHDPSKNPIREVTVKPFSLGKYEVTFEEYDRFAIATGWLLPDDNSWGRGRRPVISVTWEDAKAYATWLSQATGKRYRLPTESEWEYAARSGGKEEIWAGTSDEGRLVDYAVYAARRTAPVGSKKPNGLGLYDMSGNVFEWVEDCWHGDYHKDYKGAPTDGSAWLEAGAGDCVVRVIRSGSWDNLPVNLRASDLYRLVISHRGSDIGFRLAQDLP